MIKDSLQKVRACINTACQQANREPNRVTLLAVSKRHGADKIRAAYACGQRDFGENYLNEALSKQALLKELAIAWHFIGQIQSNKTRKIAEHFDWVHAVDSLKIAQRLSSQRPPQLPPINLCLQINIDNEASKGGLAPNSSALLALAQQIVALPQIHLRGLMCIPAPKNSPKASCETFNRMVQLQQHLNAHGLAVDTLSMGMSDDLASAVACGATIVRVGTAIFGQRNEEEK